MITLLLQYLPLSLCLLTPTPNLDFRFLCPLFRAGHGFYRARTNLSNSEENRTEIVLLLHHGSIKDAVSCVSNSSQPCRGVWRPLRWWGRL